MLDAMLNRIGEVHQRASVKTVFGEPYQVNGRTIIPVARVCYGFGFGGADAKGEEPADDETAAEGGRRAPGRRTAGGRDTSAEPRRGGGGGAGVSVRPVAVLEISAAETKVRPIVDATRLALTGMLVAAWAVFWITYTVRRTAGVR
ncbi:MAG TPA: spore germination protein GerW family protein [bacterium]|nr:spore germination protein GerW family protein [bacterium]